MSDQIGPARGSATRPIPRFVPNRGQAPDYVLWLREQTGTRPAWSYDPERRSGDVVPEIVKVLLSELRPTQGEYEAPATSVGPKHRAPSPRRWWHVNRLTTLPPYIASAS